MNIHDIKNPDFLSQLNNEELDVLCEDIRKFLIDSVSETGGHLGSNLGVVELTVALHKVFDSPKDKIIFDVGHQGYVHKILTGRANDFKTLRQYKGLSGFLKTRESEHDVWEAGHSSTSVSAAIGFAVARDLNNEDNHVIALIGDGALSGGMALEALNHIGHEKRDVIVVLNDNEMSISKNVGAINHMLNKIRTGRNYSSLKKVIKNLKNTKYGGDSIYDLIHSVKDTTKYFFNTTGRFFEDLGFTYYGPVDGHNLEDLMYHLDFVKELNGPVLLHVITNKGKGYEYSEKDIIGSWHGTGPFNKETGETYKKLDKNEESWSNIIAWCVEDCAENDRDIVAITPAMEVGSKLGFFKQKYPDRFFDVGIAEEHAATFSAALATAGKKPFLSIYSTFLQRAYDQVLHDVARSNLNLMIGIDRAGFVGEDGETHHGLYDVAFLSHIPNMVIAMPKDANEAQQLVKTGFGFEGPFALRYPRGSKPFHKLENVRQIPIGSWEVLKEGTDACIISYGPNVFDCLEASYAMAEDGIKCMVVNARFIKPMDTELIESILMKNIPILTFEEVSEIGSLGSMLVQHATNNGYCSKIKTIAVPDKFVEHGPVSKLKEEVGLTKGNIISTIEEMLER